MKTIVVSLQDENWEDDGGAHNPFVTQVPDKVFALMHNKPEHVWPRNSHLIDTLRNNTLTKMPVMIDGVMTVWTKG